MNRQCDAVQALMSGYLDGELRPEERARVDSHVETCHVCRQEFASIKQLISTSSGIAVAAPPEEVWETFLDGVYNRLERRTGWFLFVIGAVGLIALAIYYFVTEPFASAFQKTFLAVPAVGFSILFVSVLRQRLFAAKTDRYSRDIRR